MIIMRRVEFEEARVGPCAQTRYDSITPVGYEIDFITFKEEACEIIRNYGHQSYDGPGDEYSIEYFEAFTTEQNQREGGQSLLKLALEDAVWNFYEGGELRFSVVSLTELEEKWQT